MEKIKQCNKNLFIQGKDNSIVFECLKDTRKLIFLVLLLESSIWVKIAFYIKYYSNYGLKVTNCIHI